MSRYHFISGLPRSGSTLLAALLRQNPAFSAGISSPLGPLFHATRNAMGAWNETSVLLEDAQRQRILKGLFDAYYADRQGMRVVFDTNRAWCARLPALKRLFPDARVICCVRSVAWIMDSLERLIREHLFQESRLFNTDSERSTVFTRVDAPDFDQQLGLPGLHRVRAKVGPIRRQTVLPPDLFARLDALSFWRDLADSRANVIAARPDQRPATAA